VFELYPSFPARAAGAGLLFLRASLAASVFITIPEALLAKAPHLVWIGQVLLALALGLGALTPIASVCCFLLGSAVLFEGGHASGSALVTLLLAVAVALSGPGAYSLDAHWFGRRVIVFPREEL